MKAIICKEVRLSLRTAKAVILQGAFLLILAALVWLFWPAGGVQDIGGQQARSLLAIIAIAELLMVAVFGTPFPAAAITAEKQRNTWECLFATCARPWKIVLGKMAGALSLPLMLVLSGVPALALLFLLGGLRGGEILTIVVLLILKAV